MAGAGELAIFSYLFLERLNLSDKEMARRLDPSFPAAHKEIEMVVIPALVAPSDVALPSEVALDVTVDQKALYPC